MSLVFKNVTVEIEKIPILKNINCNLSEKRIAIFGNNGSGKSTLARCATQLPSLYNKAKLTGNISIYGKPLEELKKNVWQYVNLCFQIPDQQIVMPSVKEELELGLKNCPFSKEIKQNKIELALSTLDLKPDQSCHTLSTGKKRLLCLLSILILEPKTIILDEPTTFLDMPTKLNLISIIKKLSQQIIIITHDFELVKDFDRALCMHKGELYFDGALNDTYRAYKKLW